MTSAITSFGPIQLITGQNNSRFPFCNSIFVEEAGLIIDPSSNQEILGELYQQGKIKTVCLTHWHEDHFAFINLLKGCPFWISKEDAVPLRDLETFLEWYGINGPDGEHLRPIIERKMAHQIKMKPMIPERTLKDGEIIDLGSVRMEVIATPGHSPGHLSFYFAEIGVLFLGDYNLDAMGPWTGDPYSDIDQCIQSINRLRKLQAEILITGHGRQAITGNVEKYWSQYIDALSRRENQIADFLTEPKTLEQIIDLWVVVGKPVEPIEYYRFGEKAHVKKHLARMIRQGVITEENGLYRRDP